MDPDMAWQLIRETLTDLHDHPDNAAIRDNAINALMVLVDWLRRAAFRPHSDEEESGGLRHTCVSGVAGARRSTACEAYKINSFLEQYLRQIKDEIGRLHYPHETGRPSLV